MEFIIFASNLDFLVGIYDIEPIEKPKRLTTESIMMQAILPKIKIAKVDSKKSFSPKMGKSPDRMARSSNYKMAESLRKKMQNSMGIVGRCSVDLMPLIMGESKIEDVYSLEQDVMALGNNSSLQLTPKYKFFLFSR